MKRLNFVLLITIILSVTVYSQGANVNKKVDLSLFEGIWVGIDGGDTLSVTLKVIPKYYKELDKTVNLVFGNYKYGSHSKLEIDIKNEVTDYPLGAGYIEKHKGSQYLRLIFNDEIMGKIGTLLLKPTQSNEVLKWSLHDNQKIFFNADQNKKDNWGKFSVPENMTLRKVN